MCSARSVFLDLFYFQSILWSEFEEYLQFMDWKYLKFWLIALEPRSDELQIQQIDINQKGANMSTIMFGKFNAYFFIYKNFPFEFFHLSLLERNLKRRKKEFQSVCCMHEPMINVVLWFRNCLRDALWTRQESFSNITHQITDSANLFEIKSKILHFFCAHNS